MHKRHSIEDEKIIAGKEGTGLRFFKKVSKIIKCKSGASIIFILGIMMFLMAIGVSTMAAAFANIGYVTRQRDYSIVRILDESIHNNIMFSLQEDIKNENLLGWQLVRELFDVYDDEDRELLTEIDDIVIIINGIDVNNNDAFNPGGRYKVDVSFEFPFQNQIFIESGPIEAVEDLFERIPRTVDLSFEMLVIVEITVRDNRTIASRAVYEFTGGKFIENETDSEESPGSENSMIFLPDDFTEWSLIRYEVIDPDFN